MIEKTIDAIIIERGNYYRKVSIYPKGIVLNPETVRQIGNYEAFTSGCEASKPHFFMGMKLYESKDLKVYDFKLTFEI